jgi:hypothetical protein
MSPRFRVSGSKRLTAIFFAAFTTLVMTAAWTVLRPAARTPDEGFLSGAQVQPRVRSILSRSSSDCHSQATRYPWYHVLPWVSRVIDEDVRRGREQLDLSRWSEYPRLRRQRALTGIANQVKDRIMPLPAYLRLHPSANLSDDEVSAVFEWAQKERLRLIMEAVE